MFLKCKLHYNYFNALKALLSDPRSFKLFSFFRTDMFIHGEDFKTNETLSAAELLRLE